MKALSLFPGGRFLVDLRSSIIQLTHEFMNELHHQALRLADVIGPFDNLGRHLEIQQVLK